MKQQEKRHLFLLVVARSFHTTIPEICCLAFFQLKNKSNILTEYFLTKSAIFYMKSIIVTTVLVDYFHFHLIQ